MANLQQALSDLATVTGQVRAAINADQVDKAALAEAANTIERHVADLSVVLGVQLPAGPAEAPTAVQEQTAPSAAAGNAPTSEVGPTPDATTAGAGPAAGQSTVATTQAVYTHSGSDPVDPQAWSDSGLRTPDGEVLYHFAGDAPGATSGDGIGGVWHVYTGPTQPAEAATEPPVVPPAGGGPS